MLIAIILLSYSFVSATCRTPPCLQWFHYTALNYSIFKWVPFTTKSSPHFVIQVFQCLINDILRDMLGKFIIVYDDILTIYCPSPKTTTTNKQKKHVKQVVCRLTDNQFYVKSGKYEFHITHISFLGYIINPKRVFMDQCKVTMVNN